MKEQYKKGGYKYNPSINAWEKISIHQEKAKLIQKNYNIEPLIQTQYWKNNGTNIYRNINIKFEVKNGLPVGNETVLIYDGNDLIFHYDNGIADINSKFKALFTSYGIMFTNTPRAEIKLIYIPEEVHLKTLEGIIIHNSNKHLLDIYGLNKNILEVYKDTLYCEGQEYNIKSDKLYFYIEKKDNDYIITVNNFKILYPINDNLITKIIFDKSKFSGYQMNGKLQINNLF